MFLLKNGEVTPDGLSTPKVLRFNHARVAFNGGIASRVSSECLVMKKDPAGLSVSDRLKDKTEGLIQQNPPRVAHPWSRSLEE